MINDKIQTDLKYRKKIRQEIYYIKKFGIDEHFKKNKIKDKNKYLKSLYGKILFVLSVDKDNEEFIKYKMIIRKILNS